MTRTIRTAYLDHDTRREPKTDHFCAKCQRDLKPGQPFRVIHIIHGGGCVLHPDDESVYVADAGDMGCFPVGMDCARKIGIEFTSEGWVTP